MNFLMYTTKSLIGPLYFFANSTHRCSGGRSRLTTYVGAKVLWSGGYLVVSHVSLYFYIKIKQIWKSKFKNKTIQHKLFTNGGAWPNTTEMVIAEKITKK